MPTSAGTDLDVSADGHYFVKKEDGEPFYWLADTLYSFGDYTLRHEVEFTLRKRREQGFTAVKFYFYPEGDNRFGVPFWQDEGAEIINPAYLDHLVFVAERARAYGMYLFFVMSDERTSAKVYADVTQRFRNQPNIIWSQFQSKDTAQVEGIYQGITGGAIPSSPSDPMHKLLFVTTYTGDYLVDEPWSRVRKVGGERPAIDEYMRQPPRPAFGGDGFYEGNRYDGTRVQNKSPDLQGLRAKFWIDTIWGTYFTFGHRGAYNQTEGWLKSLDSPGTDMLSLMAQFWQARRWWRLVPQTKKGNAIHVASSADGDGIYAYYPKAGLSAQVDLSLITAADKARVSWLDPASGRMELVGDRDTTGPSSFTTPGGWSDGVLVVEPATEAPFVALSACNTGASTRLLDGIVECQRGTTGAITFEAEAIASEDRSITKVEFLIGTTVIATDNNGSDGWQASWTGGPPGSYQVRARATDTKGNSSTSEAWHASIVLPGKPALHKVDLPKGEVGNDYLTDHYVSFNPQVYRQVTWQVTSGSLPPGLSIDESGIYRGTPTEKGSFTFTLQATSSDGTDSESFTHVID